MIAAAILITLLFLVPAAALATTNSTDDGDECMPFDPSKAMECARKYPIQSWNENKTRQELEEQRLEVMCHSDTLIAYSWCDYTR